MTAAMEYKLGRPTYRLTTNAAAASATEKGRFGEGWLYTLHCSCVSIYIRMQKTYMHFKYDGEPACNFCSSKWWFGLITFGVGYLWLPRSHASLPALSIALARAFPGSSLAFSLDFWLPLASLDSSCCGGLWVWTLGHHTVLPVLQELL